ncbi:hypothetical protein BKA70DRAFT_873520 [Coprinopsis sp. MPI-PUGE-AT-0042]|nr:hypothetical protein BKA70DRAFT_873520 [Coprinopsis sp. MPI-PUGE-AT-0042]
MPTDRTHKRFSYFKYHLPKDLHLTPHLSSFMPRKTKNKPRSHHPLKSQESTRKPVGLLVTEDLESAIASCRKEVDSIVKACRARNVRFRDRDFDLQFDPFRCLNGYTPSDLLDAPQKDVQRVTEIYDDPHFFPKGGAVTSNAIAQGSLGDCYFLAALATVSSFPSLIEKICVARDEVVGVYGFIFYGDHGWTSVIVDDLLYTKVAKFEELSAESKALYHNSKDHYNAVARKGGKTLLFAGAGSQDEMWVPLIEKAYAKHYGNYSHLDGGWSCEAVEDLTGGVSSVFFPKDILDTDRFWTEELLHANKDRVFACGFNTLKPTEDYPWAAPDVEGLIGGHAYSILRAVDCKGKRFVVLRNPWGKGEWTGRWSDGSQEWTREWLDALPELDHVFGNDGQFVMEYSDFLQRFDDIERTFLFDDTWVASSQWMGVPLYTGLRAQAYGILSFLVTIESATKAIFSLSRLNRRSFNSIEEPNISMGFALVRVGDSEPIAKAFERRPFASRSITLELEAEAGSYCVYVCFDREDGNYGFDDNGKNESARVKSTILSNIVRAQSVVEDWDPVAEEVFIPKTLEQIIAEDHLESTTNPDEAPEEDAGNEENAEADEAEGEKNEADDTKAGHDEAEKTGTSGDGGSGSDEEDEWKDLLNDDGSTIFVGMRVYTQNKEPSIIVGRLRCEGGKLCLCGECE